MPVLKELSLRKFDDFQSKANVINYEVIRPILADDRRLLVVYTSGASSPTWNHFNFGPQKGHRSELPSSVIAIQSLTQ